MISFAGPLVNDEVDQAPGLLKIPVMSVAIRPICLTFFLCLTACASTAERACDHLEGCDFFDGNCLDYLTQLESDAEAAACDDEMDAYLSCLVDVDTTVCQETQPDNATIVLCPGDVGAVLVCLTNAQADP